MSLLSPCLLGQLFPLYLIHFLFVLVFSVMSKQGIYVSHLTGNDSKTCGEASFPCRTISYAIQQLSTGLYIYINGTDTLKNPYTCGALDPGKIGIYLKKSVSFVSINSRAYISCRHGNSWLVYGTENKGGVRISFSGLAFVNTSLYLFDAYVVVNDTLFMETKVVSLLFRVSNLPRFYLSLNNVVFQQNEACIAIICNYAGSRVQLINITNTVFYQNGNSSSKFASIFMSLSRFKKLMNIQMKNCSFKKNTFTKFGMVEVTNNFGTINVSLNQLRVEENSQTNPSVLDNYFGAFRFVSTRTILSLKYGFISKINANFLNMIGISAQIDISNVAVDGFYSVTPGGGGINIMQHDSCSMSIKDSTFRNGNSNDTGGLVSIIAPNSTLSIQNSIIWNISSFNQGGAVYIQSSQNALLRITNVSFSYSASTICGGAVCVTAGTLLMFVHGSEFLRNSAINGAAIHIYIPAVNNVSIGLSNSHFIENSASDGGIIEVSTLRKESSFSLSINNVMFVKNRLATRSQHTWAIIYLNVKSTMIAVNFKNVHFIGNALTRGTCFHAYFNKSSSHSITLDTCIFRQNIGFSIIFAGGYVSLACKNSIFDSNIVTPGSQAVIMLYLRQSTIFIMNTTFVNNLGGSLSALLGGNYSLLKINNSVFVRNKNIGSVGTLILLTMSNQHNPRFIIRIERVLFQENIAVTGSVLYMGSSDVLFENCTFLNNFSSLQGGVIISGIGSSGRGTTNLAVYHSVFRQTIKKIVINNTKEFIPTSFLRLFSSGTLTVGNTTFSQNTKLDVPLILIPSANRILFDEASLSFCPVGHDIVKNYYIYTGINGTSLIGLTFSCKECDHNMYSLQRGTARGLATEDAFQCLPCPRGGDCIPAIKSRTNYWGYQVSLNPPKLAFTICPFGYCKSPPTNRTDYNACQGKRTGVMCGMCSHGYSEALWSTYCTSNKDCKDHWFWILFVALIFFMAIILVFKPPLVTYFLKQIFWFRTSNHTANTQAYHDISPSSFLDEETAQENISLSPTIQRKQDKRQFLRFVDIIFYFYQIAQLLLSSSSLTEFFDIQFFQPVLGFFNFQPSFSNQGLLCPFPGLTPETKLVFKIAPVFGTLIAIFLIYGLRSFISRLQGSIRPSIAPYFQASIKTIVLGYVALATVSISLIRCVFVAGESRWFYNGNITCYQWWQYASFIINTIFVIPFIFVLAFISFKLHHDGITVRQFISAIIFPLPFLILWLLRVVCSSAVANVEENENISALKELLLAPYKQPNGADKRGALYWQSVLIARRFILVLIFSVVTEPSIRLFSMTFACVLVFFYHLKVKPFQNPLANNCESFSLLLLILLGLINLFKSVFVGSEQNIKGSLVTVLKVFQWLEIVMLGLFPAVLLLLLFFALISFSVRVFFVCCWSISKFLIRPCAQRWFPRDSSQALLDVCDSTDDYMERDVIS